MPEADKILIVDDQPANRELLTDQLAMLGFGASEARDGLEALEMMAADPPHLVIMDIIMPRMHGFAALEEIKASPSLRDIPVVVISAIDEMKSILHCIEIGAEDYLTRPVHLPLLEARVRNALQKGKAARAWRDMLETTLRESIRALSNVLALVNPVAYTRAARVAREALAVAEELHFSSPWELEIAALLSQLGLAAVPEQTLRKAFAGGSLTSREAAVMQRQAATASDLIDGIPRLESVSEIIRYHQKNFDGSGLPADGRSGKDLPAGARILKPLFDVDDLVMAGSRKLNAVRAVRQRPGACDPQVVDAIERLASAAPRDAHLVCVPDLLPGMILDQDLLTLTGLLLVPRGSEITASICRRLENYAEIGEGLIGAVKVLLPGGLPPPRSPLAVFPCDFPLSGRFSLLFPVEQSPPNR